jgi:hypothetical protein
MQGNPRLLFLSFCYVNKTQDFCNRMHWNDFDYFIKLLFIKLLLLSRIL